MTRNIFLVLLVAIAMLSCVEDSIIGSNLLTDEDLNLEFVDLSPVPMTTVLEEPVPVFIIGDFGTSDLRTYPLGSIDEPIFGSTETTIYVDVHKSVGTPDFAGATLDSMVLLLPYDTLGRYGNLDATHLIEVFELDEEFGDRDTFYTNTNFMFSETAIGSVSLVPNTQDSIFAYEPELDSIVSYIPHLRVRLNDDYTSMFFEENDGVQDDTTFTNTNFGFAIKSTPSDNSFFGINLSNSSLDQRELAVYYTTEQDSAIRYDFPIALSRSYSNTIDYSSSDVGNALADVTISDSLLYVQSIEGVNIEVDLSAVDDLTDISLNVAELVFFMAELGEDDLDLYPPINAFNISYENDAGNIVLIDDYTLSLQINDFFGGTLEEDANGLKKYTLGITSHVLNIMNNEISSKKIFVKPVRREQEPNRSIIYGPKHSQFPAKLRLVITTN